MQPTTERPMINISKVSEWLTQNANEHLYPRLFLMSPNGTLLAYSKPVDIKELRDQAALISMAWKDHCTSKQASLKTLTIETEDCNIIVRLLQQELVLVLVGKLPPGKRQTFKVTPEGRGDPRYPDLDISGQQGSSELKIPQGDATTEDPATSTKDGPGKGKAPSVFSHMSQREKDIRVGTLHVQRKRLDALAEYILKDFVDTGFVMPADSDLQ